MSESHASFAGKTALGSTLGIMFQEARTGEGLYWPLTGAHGGITKCARDTETAGGCGDACRLFSLSGCALWPRKQRPPHPHCPTMHPSISSVCRNRNALLPTFTAGIILTPPPARWRL